MAQSQLRVIIDPPAEGAWNMAVDEALLHSTEFDGLTLRFYEWERPTLSLGYFQELAERDQHAASLACPVVRRASGGGAILHDRELTYSLVAPVAQRFGDSAIALYDLVHQSLCDALAKWNIRATMFQPASSPLPRSAEPFLCFQRRSAGDVLLAGHKICGSAQRRHQFRILQHGSLLWARSMAAPELPGLSELVSELPTLHEQRMAWVARLAQVLQRQMTSGELSVGEREQAARIFEGKFNSHKWTAKR